MTDQDAIVQWEFSPTPTRTAVWQCPRCQRVLEHQFSNMVSYSMEGQLWCACYSLQPAHGCVERRTITKMTPLNAAAVGHERSCQDIREQWLEKEREEQLARQRVQDYLDSWGPLA